MSVYFKFKSAKDFNSIPIEGQFISIGTLKERIFELKHLGRGTDFDLVVSNAQTEEEYTDEASVIPKNTSVLIRRVPGRPRMRIQAQPDQVKSEGEINHTQTVVPPPSNNNNFNPEPYSMNNEESEWDEFGNDPYASIQEGQQSQSFNPNVTDASNVNKIDEESKIRALVETPALDWSSQNDGFRGGRGFGRGGRMMSGRGFGRGGGFENRNPPPGYVCHRCKTPGHFIQHCPTNGDPTYDVKRTKPPTGIPKSMLMAASDGSYTLPSGAVAVLQPNEAAFDREMEGMPNSSRVSKVMQENIPANLHCPLCKQVMKDAVLTSKCCFSSFCDQCIREYIMENDKCVCGATNVLADHLIPNMTLRANIREILETAATSSTDYGGSLAQVQDMQSVVPQVQHKEVVAAVSPAGSAGGGSKEESKGQIMDDTINVINNVNNNNNVNINNNDKSPEVVMNLTPESRSGKEIEKSPNKSPLLRENMDHNNINNKQNPVGDPAKKKKKKKVARPTGDEMQWRGYNENMGTGMQMDGFGGMQMQMGGGAGFNPYFGGMGPVMGMDPFINGPPFGGPMNPFMGMPPVPGPFMPPVPDPFMGQPPFMMPPGPPRDLAELAMGGMNMGPPPGMRWDESFEARRPPTDMRRKKDSNMDMYNERERREVSREREGRRERREETPRERRERREGSRDSYYNMEARKERRVEYQSGNARDVMNHKHRISSSSSQDRSEKDRPAKLRHQSPRRTKKRSSDRDEPPSPPAAAAASIDEPPSKKQKGSVFSRISFPGGAGTSKKAKKTEESDLVEVPPVKKSSRGKEERYEAAPAAEDKARYGRRASSYDEEEEDEESEEERHFKRKSRRKEAAAAEEEEEEERRNSRRSSKDHHRHASSSSRHLRA
ncbi:hypothetical protein LUZ60_005575 [Juncus effusus]|nr:hypothetical protein LUZ60_005575 [Juncus effusus]